MALVIFSRAGAIDPWDLGAQLVGGPVGLFAFASCGKAGRVGMSSYERQTFKRSRLVALAVLFGTGVVTLNGCGGGGGGGGSSALTYSGSTDPAAVTRANATTLVSNVLFGGEAGTSVVPLSVSGDGSAELSPGGEVLSQELKALSLWVAKQYMEAQAGDAAPLSRELVNETLPCDNPDGTARVSGALDDVTGTGTLTIRYNNCLLDEITYDGSGVLDFKEWDFGYFVPTNFTARFDILRATGGSFDGSISGRIDFLVMISSNKDSTKLNLVAKDNISGKMYWYKPLTVEGTYDDVLFPSSYTSNVYGKVYDSAYGYVDVQTDPMLGFSDISVEYPDVEGTMRYLGGTSSIRMTVVPGGTQVTLELDIDGVPGYEISHTMTWTELRNQIEIP
jgi:hypothetical protein